MLYLTVAVSPAENALHDANEAMTTINLSNTWEGVLGRIKWVMDAVSPVAEVRCNVLIARPCPSRICSQLHPHAKMAYNLLFVIPKVICLRYCRMGILVLYLFGR